MKKTKLYIGLALFAISGLLLIAADHADVPAVTGNASDITDVYAFQGQDTNNMVFVVNKTGTTTFFDGTNVLTGRRLADDVTDVELLLIFGGPTGASNPGLTSDHVASNDKSFSTTFPYLASAW